MPSGGPDVCMSKSVMECTKVKISHPISPVLMLVPVPDGRSLAQTIMDEQDSSSSLGNSSRDQASSSELIHAPSSLYCQSDRLPPKPDTRCR